LDGRRKSQAPPLLEKDMLIPTYKNWKLAGFGWSPPENSGNRPLLVSSRKERSETERKICEIEANGDQQLPWLKIKQWYSIIVERRILQRDEWERDSKDNKDKTVAPSKSSKNPKAKVHYSASQLKPPGKPPFKSPQIQ
jgi:hypothetical protein